MTDISRINGTTPAETAKPKTSVPAEAKESLPDITDKAVISGNAPLKPTTGEKIGGYVMGTFTAGVAGAFRGARGSVDGAVDGIDKGHKTGSKIVHDLESSTTLERVLAASAGLCLAAAGASMVGPLGAVIGFAAGTAIGASLPTFAGAAVGSVKGLVKGAAEGVHDGWKAGNRFGQEFVHYIKDAFHVGK